MKKIDRCFAVFFTAFLLLSRKTPIPLREWDVTLLQYKCDWYGKELVKVNRFYPSSKTCGNCGWINQELKLSDREWTCKSCGVVHDRDWNASRNILKEGLKNISAGTVEYKGGEEIRPTSLAHSVKPEAPSALAKG